MSATPELSVVITVVSDTSEAADTQHLEKCLEALRRQADAPAFLPHIDHHAAPGFRHHAHGLMQLRPAIAAPRTEHVARETFAVNAHKHVLLPRDFAAHQ